MPCPTISAADPPAVLFADTRFVAIDKPAGLACHPSRAGGPSVEDFFASWRRGGAGPWLAHRLDRDTAGCLLIARRKTALIAAQAEFAAGRARKTYWALVRGVPAAGEGTIDLPLARVEAGRAWRMAGSPEGLPARTAWRVLGAAAGTAWLELRPRTGRTHQLRAHCAALGHPILGDAVYGGGEPGGLGLFSRALGLALVPEMLATAPPPAHMTDMLRRCGWKT